MKVIKRYANRKLYDTERSCYVTLDEIAEMVRSGDDLQIIDQRTQHDLTSVTLAQILYEEEKRSRRIIPLDALRSIIRNSGEFLQRISLPVQQFREETQRSFDRIPRPGEVLDEGRQALRDYAQNIQRGIDDLQKRIDERIKDAVDSLTHLPELETSVSELLERLDTQQRQIDKLNRMVDQLWETRTDNHDRRFGRHRR